MSNHIIWLRNCTLDAVNSGMVVIGREITPLLTNGIDTIIIEPGSEVSGRALELAAALNIYFFYTSAGATKLLAWFSPPTALQNIELQYLCVNDSLACGTITRYMVSKRFGRDFHPAHPISVLRGYEGAMVKKIYRRLARKYDIAWNARSTDISWSDLDPLNRCISLCNSALYSVTEIAILRAGFSPYFGFVHNKIKGGGKSLVYDIADIVKFDRITPIAFRHAASGKTHPEWRAVAECARLFRSTSLIDELTALTSEVMNVGKNSLTSNAFKGRCKNLSRNLAGRRSGERKIGLA